MRDFFTNDNGAADRRGGVIEPPFPKCTALLAHVIASDGVGVAARHGRFGRTQSWGRGGQQTSQSRRQNTEHA